MPRNNSDAPVRPPLCRAAAFCRPPTAQTTSTPATAAETPQMPPSQIPAGTILQIRLRQTVSSFGSKRDTPVSAAIIAPVESSGHIVLPLNSELRGTLARVSRVGIGVAREKAILQIELETLTLPDGSTTPVHGHVVAVDDSRETIDAQGRIQGIRATAIPSRVVSGFAVSAAGMNPMLLLFGMSSSLSVFRIPESEIILPAGTSCTSASSSPFPSQEPLHQVFRQ